MEFNLYDFTERKNNPTVFKSVFCHPGCSAVSVLRIHPILGGFKSGKTIRDSTQFRTSSICC